MSRVAIASVIAGIILLATGHVSSSTGATQIGFTVDADPGTGGVQASASIGVVTFSVDVLISDVADLQAFNFELEYDQTVLSAPTVAAGPDTDRNPDAADTFLTSTSRVWSCSPPSPSGDADPSPSVGAAFISCFSTGVPAGPSAGGAGTVLASVEFDAIAPGTSSLTFRNVNTFAALGIETGSCSPTVIAAATCTGVTITILPDADGDGEPDASDNCPNTVNAGQENADGDPFGDACETPECIAVATVWVTPPGDTDCDSFTTTVENFVGTDPTDSCANTAAANDEADDRWPADTNDNQFVNVFDVVPYIAALNSVGPNPPYFARLDLNASGGINVFDVVPFIQLLNKACLP